MHSSTSSLLLLAQRRRSQAPAARKLDHNAVLRQQDHDRLRRSEAPAPVVRSTVIMGEWVE